MPQKPTYSCPVCGAGNIKRNGTHKKTNSQKLICKDCGVNFREKYIRSCWVEGSDRQMTRLLHEGKSIRAIAKRVNVSPTTVQSRRKSAQKELLSLLKETSSPESVFEVKTPLRYPGGKSKVLDIILPYIPADMNDYREPFIGGGSVFLSVRSLFGEKIQCYWINDLQPDLCHFWKALQHDPAALVQEIMTLRQKHPVGKKLYQHLLWNFDAEAAVERAARFFVLNRITFSGVIEAGGYSENAFQQRFTETAIQKLLCLTGLLQGVDITCGGYETVLQEPGQNVFVYLDPPYLSATASKLYGMKGELHTGFDHERFAYHAKISPHRWLITYDDSPEVRKLFAFANMREYNCQYGMNNFKQSVAKKGNELIITNMG